MLSFAFVCIGTSSWAFVCMCLRLDALVRSPSSTFVCVRLHSSAFVWARVSLVCGNYFADSKS